MIQVHFKRGSDDSIRGFNCTGHAGAGIKGKDVVCAAVSMIVINTVNSIEVLSPEDTDKMKVSADNEKGEIDCSFDGEASEKAALLLNSLYLGLKTIESEYGKEYIEVSDINI